MAQQSGSEILWNRYLTFKALKVKDHSATYQYQLNLRNGFFFALNTFDNICWMSGCNETEQVISPKQFWLHVQCILTISDWVASLISVLGHTQDLISSDLCFMK